MFTYTALEGINCSDRFAPLPTTLTFALCTLSFFFFFFFFFFFGGGGGWGTGCRV